jgi:GNAT superfamily N-acetyltransferase
MARKVRPPLSDWDFQRRRGDNSRYVGRVVRPRRDEDLERLIVLLRSVHRADGYPANWPTDPRRWLAGSSTIAAWVFEDAGEAVGHLALTWPDPERTWPQWQAALQMPFAHIAVMRRLFVAPGYRRQQVATQLMKVAGRRAAELGLHLVLDVADDNHGAILFWRTHGWRQVGEATLPPGDEGHALRLLLLVGPPRH